MNPQSFKTFFELWLNRLELYHQEFVHALECNNKGDIEDEEQRWRELIDRMFGHYGEFFGMKGRVRQGNMFQILKPSWFNSFDMTYLWIGGYRPQIAFNLVHSNLRNLTYNQYERINKLMQEIKDEEAHLSSKIVEVNKVMWSQPMIDMEWQRERVQNGERSYMDSIMDNMKLTLEGLVECADNLRKKTVILIMEILKPKQGVSFLAAIAEKQLKLHRPDVPLETHNLV